MNNGTVLVFNQGLNELLYLNMINYNSVRTMLK